MRAGTLVDCWRASWYVSVLNASAMIKEYLGEDCGKFALFNDSWA
jgi:hypothetical protein